MGHPHDGTHQHVPELDPDSGQVIISGTYSLRDLIRRSAPVDGAAEHLGHDLADELVYLGRVRPGDQKAVADIIDAWLDNQVGYSVSAEPTLAD
jgi:hypothetical protein